jgi:hypothetical protein
MDHRSSLAIKEVLEGRRVPFSLQDCFSKDLPARSYGVKTQERHDFYNDVLPSPFNVEKFLSTRLPFALFFMDFT